MLSYAAELKAVPNATGDQLDAVAGLIDQVPIDLHARVAVNSIAGGKTVASKALFAAKGEINPFVILVAMPALLAAIAGAWRERDRVAAFGAAWCVGTFIPFVIQASAFDRISYLYYMLLVMPGIYMATAWLFSPSRVPRSGHARLGHRPDLRVRLPLPGAEPQRPLNADQRRGRGQDDDGGRHGVGLRVRRRLRRGEDNGRRREGDDVRGGAGAGDRGARLGRGGGDDRGGAGARDETSGAVLVVVVVTGAAVSVVSLPVRVRVVDTVTVVVCGIVTCTFLVTSSVRVIVRVVTQPSLPSSLRPACRSTSWRWHCGPA